MATLSLLVWVDLALLFSLNRSVQNARMQQEWQWSAELWSAAESGINQQILRWQNMPISLPFPSLRFLFIVDCTNIKGYCTVICEVTGHRRKVRLKAWYSQALKQAVAWQAL
ncbi:MAG TPA: hypothetical protein VJB02_02025 [Coxiellaceae bacterium]|nr:hypothetical protein [Coxiellaceae bacterium]